MKILMTATNPVTNDPRILKEAKALIEAGHDITIVAWDRECKNPSETTKEGINIIRVPVRASYGNMKEFIKTLPIFYKKAYKIIKKLDFDAIHTHDFDTAFLGYILKKQGIKSKDTNKRIKWVYDVHDLYESFVEKNNPNLSKIISKLDGIFMKNADTLIVTTEYVRDLLSKRMPEVSKKITIVSNSINSPNILLKTDKSEFMVFYGGVLSRTRYILEMMDICEELNIKMTIAGIGVLENEIKKRCEKSNYLKFLGELPHKELLEEMNDYSLNFAIYDPSIQNNMISVPNKLFESMCLGIPIIVIEGSYMANVVKTNNCGLTVQFNEQSVKETILKLKTDKELYKTLSENAVKAYPNYTWNKQVEKLLKMYNSFKN
ncbi:glycosyltransferase involved in cell wall biosynthesis [Methanococcus voltae PS]|uniref:Glycosyltransferase involved in cell wall biosynthesis n=1 Tax=Methanococcus voltae PS TaxID=523842 RepID=A0ABT2EZ00_METVO|nr:glycosyltransferase family 4 protein [Methanococcus voltae]MCS3922225.1 glycosyltransferase involved in cell wall biosynthesis [Methanococcus voltae PS]